MDSGVQREIRSVEVSLLVHATEDEERLEAEVMNLLGIVRRPERENLEGFFGNCIIRLKWHMLGDEACDCFAALLALLGPEGRRELIGQLDAYLDEHGSLYLRLGKQALIRGEARLSPDDAVRLKVKPLGYMIGRDVSSFYCRLIEGAR